jgi:ATP-dependent Clp protease ATP-binding subunit ClpX
MSTSTYFPVSANMSALFYRLGSNHILRYGRLLNRLFRVDLFQSPDAKKQEILLNQARRVQQEVVSFFEGTESGNKSPVKALICKSDKPSEVDVRKLSIVSCLFAKVIVDNEEAIPLSFVISASAVDPDNSSPLEYRRVCASLLAEDAGIISIFGSKDDSGFVPHLTLSKRAMIVLCGSERSIPFINHESLELLNGFEKSEKVSKPPPPKPSAQTDIIPTFSAREIEKTLQTWVIGQEEVVRSLSVRLFLHLQKARMIMKGEEVSAPNEVVLLIGSPSSGKSYISSTLPKVITGKKNIPYVSISAIDCTETGYVGMDIEIIPKNLIRSAGNDLTLARTGIAFIDELDKRASRTISSSNGDISAGMQYGLLKLIEGSEMILNEKRAVTRDNPIHWNSYGVMFVLAGAFDGLEEILKRRIRKSGGIGFSGQANNRNNLQLYSDALVDYGISRQLISRVTCILQLKDPSVEDLLRILNFDKGILSAYNQLLAPSKLHLALSEDAQLEIAEYA